MPLAKRRSEQENVFTTNNTRPNQKINRLNQSALILTQGLTTVALQCTVKPFFSSFSQNHNRSIKKQNKITSNNHNKQSEKTFQNLSIKNTPKTNHNKQTRKTISPIVKSITQTITTKITHTISQSKTRSKQTQQAITKNAMFLNFIISQTATCFELTEISPLIKTQYNRKKQNNRADTLR